MRRAIALASVAGLSLAAAPSGGPEPPAPPAPARALDWCATVAVRPDARFETVGSTCLPSWSDREIASGADVILLGSESDVEKPNAATHPGSQCRATETHPNNARYIDKLRAMRAAQGGTGQRFVHLSRFDIVTDTLAADPGFRAEFLVGTDRPWSQVESFFAADRSPACGVAGCRFTPAWGGFTDRNGGAWLADSIRRTGGDPERVVYYLVRAAQVKQSYWPTAALADQRNPAYRSWRVALAKRAVEVGHYDAILLNNKFHQYREPHWIGSAKVPDAEALRAVGDDTFWTAPPRDYDGSAYLAGWLALARDLASAGVPYALQMPAWPSTLTPIGAASGPETLEFVRQVARRARLVLLERHAYGDRSGLLAFAADLERAGVEVVWVDGRCGFKRP